MVVVVRFSELEKQFRSSLHCLLHKAKLQIDADQLVEAHATFAKVRQTMPSQSASGSAVCLVYPLSTCCLPACPSPGVCLSVCLSW